MVKTNVDLLIENTASFVACVQYLKVIINLNVLIASGFNLVGDISVLFV